MKVLVTGGAGYVGSMTTQRLIESGHAVRVLDRLDHGGTSLLTWWGRPEFELMAGDVRTPAVLQAALEGVDAVVHLAAIVGDPACAREPDAAREINLEASRQLLGLARSAGVKRFVFASTCSNYGKMSHEAAYVDESSELNPISLYAETKVGFERDLLDGASPEGMITTVLRLATVFGLSPRMRFDLTVNEFTRSLLLDRKLEVYGEQFWRPYVHVTDVARAIALVLEAAPEAVRGEVFNLGDTSQNYTKKQLVEMISAVLPSEPAIRYVNVQEDPRDYRVSFSKIQERLGFGITRTVEDGIREVLEALSDGVFPDPMSPLYRN